MDLGERLHRLQQLGLHKGSGRLTSPPPPSYRSIAEVVEGEWLATRYGTCFVSTREEALESVRGSVSLGACLDLDSEAIAACAGDPHLRDLDVTRAAFIDTETTGLAGGTGTFAFLIGVGTFEADKFTVRQFFMPSPGDERSLLAAVCETLDRCTSVVSYNGRVFDLPLLNTRLLLNRELPRLEDAPHLDLLFPTRRVWRARLGSCTLGNVERTALGIHRTESDVPGWLVPLLYREYLRTGTAHELGRVFYHNLEDILSLVTLATVLCGLFASSDDVSTVLDDVPSTDRVSLGSAYERLGWAQASERAYVHALSDDLPGDQRDRALHQLSFLLKSMDRRDEAAHWWQVWSEEVTSHTHVIPHVELAKHHEWHAVDVDAALHWTEAALEQAQSWPPSPRRRRVLLELQHRHARLQRKSSDSSADEGKP